MEGGRPSSNSISRPDALPPLSASNSELTGTSPREPRSAKASEGGAVGTVRRLPGWRARATRSEIDEATVSSAGSLALESNAKVSRWVEFEVAR